MNMINLSDPRTLCDPGLNYAEVEELTLLTRRCESLMASLKVAASSNFYELESMSKRANSFERGECDLMVPFFEIKI